MVTKVLNWLSSDVKKKSGGKSMMCHVLGLPINILLLSTQ